MKIKLLTLLALCWASLSVAQTTIVFSGQVFFGIDQAPADNYPVFIYEAGTNTTMVAETNTDGIYEVALDVDSAPGDVLEYTVETFDFCTGVVYSFTSIVDPLLDEPVVNDFHVCTDVNPPPPPEDCEAFFTYEAIPDAPLSIQFYDLSYADVDLVVYSWSFGDGTTSNEAEPFHTYSEPGEYVVTLTIVADDCTSIFETVVYVGVDNPCNCDDIYDPVCIADPATGVVFTFPNECEAICAGFSPDDFVDCQNCACPDVWDPVCVFFDNGDVFTFSNSCEAECAGYFEYQNCDGNGGDCYASFTVEYLADDPLTATFFDQSVANVGEITSWLWSFGDGTTSLEQNPTHTYELPGDYEVSLTITTSDGCTATVTEWVWVGDMNCICPDVYDPVCVQIDPAGGLIEFVNECEAICAGFGPDQFVDCENGCFCPAVWDPVCVTLDDGTVLVFGNSCEAECEGYTDYQSCDGNGDVCEANFTYQLDANDNLTVQFTDDSYTGAGEIISWLWDFGDGTTSTEQNPTHTYAEPGDYVVTLTITTSEGCTAIFEQWVWVGNMDCVCPDVWDPVCIIDPAGFLLLFGNECEAICAGFTPDQFIDCEDNCGCPDFFDPVCVVLDDGTVLTFSNSCEAECEGYTDYQSCDGNGDVCHAFFTYEIDPDNNLIVHFTDGSYTGAGEIVSWEWVFADGTTSNEQNPTHEFAQPGDYEITLTITTSEGCTATYTQWVWVGDMGGCDCFDVWDPVCVDIGGGIILPFGNECEAICAGFDPSTFVDCDEDCICPDVWDPVCVVGADGNIITFSNACEANCAGYGEDSFVDCVNGPCNCSFIYDPVCVTLDNGEVLFFPNACVAECEGFGEDQYQSCDGPGGEDCQSNFFVEQPDPALPGLVQFYDESFANEGEITEWHWEFGDGTGSMEQSPEHVYNGEGIFEVTLTIVTSTGCTSTIIQHICIGDGTVYEGPDCQAIFFFDQHDANNTFTFVDLSIGAIETWAWDFGDGTTSNEPNPTHSYDEPGVYTVTLTVSTGDCESTISLILFTDVNIWYDSECTALFIPFVNPGTLEVFFLNLSSPDAVTFEWDFGDGTTSSQPITLHEFSESGVYTITLTITTEDGCTNTYSVTLDLDNNNLTGNPTYRTTTSTEEEWVVEGERLYPNPTSDLLNLEFNVAKAGTYQIRLMGVDGRVISAEKLEAIQGTNVYQMNVGQLQAGFYFLQLESAEVIRSLKFVKE